MKMKSSLSVIVLSTERRQNLQRVSFEIDIQM
jgi:hypothetical protein